MDHEERDFAAELQRRIASIANIGDFLNWLGDSDEFMIVDISENTDTPMGEVSDDVVLNKYRDYLTECLADVESFLKD